MPVDPLTYVEGQTVAAGGAAGPQSAVRPGDADATEDRPDYKCETYRDMEPYWELCRDIRGGTREIRAKANQYLPRFEAEGLADWEARIRMTFANDHYEQTLEDLVGLVCAEDVALDPDAARVELVPLMENVDGEGNALAVFARTLLEWALDDGHAALLTDYPDTAAIKAELGRDLTLADVNAQEIRPYWCAYRASDILSWRWVKLGSVHVLQKVVLRERVTKNAGAYGSATVERYRVLEQATVTNARGEVRAMGAITFKVFERRDEKGKADFVSIDAGRIIGPKRIPLRIVYGGKKCGRLHTRPFLLGLAYNNVKETQIESDYASIMHKCNVPTPIFIGRGLAPDGTQSTVQMGQGVDVPIGGGAEMLEPSGAALGATRQRLQDVQADIRRQGATLHVQDQQMTATEAAIAARQRNAKLAKAARSLQDALEGGGSDMLAFLNVEQPVGEKVGFDVNMEFAEGSFDPLFVAACRDAYIAGALPLEAYLYVLQTGKLPDDFDAEDAALRLVAEEAARRETEQQDQQDPKEQQDPNDPKVGA